MMGTKGDAGAHPAARASGLEGLLEPSLERGEALQPPYSVRAAFLVAFFGGSMAGAIFFALNSRRLGRLSRDAWLLVAIAVVGFGCLVVFAQASQQEALPAWFAELGEPRRTFRLASRLLALLSFGAYYLLIRRQWRAAELAGETASAWRPALLCIGGSVVVAALGLVLGGAV